MAYTEVHTMTFAARAAGDVRGRVEMALIKKAGIRSTEITSDDDQREKRVCLTLLDGVAPVQWTTAVLIALDIAGQLTNPTPAQVDTAVNTAWTYLTSSRG